MTDDEKISKLLKLKRYEQPAPGYFDDFLREFQVRQRSEIVQRSLWEIVSERLTLVMQNFEVPRVAYASIAALAVVATMFVVVRPIPETSSSIAQLEPLSLSSQRPVTIGENLPVALTSTGKPAVHYVLPTRPVSYASAHSF